MWEAIKAIEVIEVIKYMCAGAIGVLITKCIEKLFS